MNTKRVYKTPSYVKKPLHASDAFRVMSWGGGQALTVHNLATGTSVGVEGADVFAVTTYAEALSERHPRLPQSAIWGAVWRDFDMDSYARRDCDVPKVEYVS